MTKRVTISLEQDRARVLYARKRGRGYVIEDILTLDYSELDRFLDSEKTKGFYVCASFSDYLQNTLYLPPTGRSKLRKLLELELSRTVNYPEGFVFTYFDLGKTVIEGHTKKEIFAVSVPQRQVKEYLSIFKRHNKRVKCLLPDFLSLLNIVPYTDYPVLYIYSKRTERIMFLVERGRLYFYRSFSAISETIDDIDFQNINMTVNYCKQKLGAEAAVAMFIGDPEFSQNLAVDPVIPVANMAMPEDFELRGSSLALSRSDIILPLSLLRKKKAPDLLPSEYRLEGYLQTYLKAASIVFALSALLLAGLTVNNVINIRDNQRQIKMIRSQLTGLPELISELNTVRAEYNTYRVPLKYLIAYRESPSPLNLLIALPKALSERIKIKSIKINSSVHDKKISFIIEGLVKTSSMAEFQSMVNEFVSGIRSVKGIKDIRTSYNLERRDFIVKGWY